MTQMPSERLIEQGLKLIARAAVEAPDAAERCRQALARWRAASPAHEAAAVEALRRWQLLGGMADDLRLHFDTCPAPPTKRRQALLGLTALVGTVALTGATSAWYWHRPLFQQAYETGNAQLHAITLPDRSTSDGHAGSRIELNAETRLVVSLYRHQRVVNLSRGEAYFDVAPNAEKPFIVDTRMGRLTVLGTAFTLEDRGGPLSIEVQHGRVRFEPLPQPGTTGQSAIVLQAGQGLTLRHGLAGSIRSLDAMQAGAWRHGWLVFDNTRLDDAMPAINAHRAQPLILGDPQVAALSLSGRFKAADSAGLIEALPLILPLRVIRRADGRFELLSAPRTAP